MKPTPANSVIRRARLLLPAFLVFAACAGPQTRMPAVDSAAIAKEAREQKKLALQGWFEQDMRVQRIAYRLLTAGTELCGQKVGPIAGFSLLNRHDFPSEWLAAAEELYGVGDRPQIATVVPGSAAEAAGLEPGDIVLRVGDWETPQGKAAPRKTIDRAREVLAKQGRLTLHLLRGGAPLAVTLEPVRACSFAITIDNDDAVNAYADGHKIVLQKGMLRFARTDEELALVLAHELAHNAMGHVDAARKNALVGGAVGLLLDIAAAAAGVNTQGSFTDAGMRAGANAYSVDFEREADYVGMYLLARAGFDITDAPQFWRRMGAENPDAIVHNTTHPTTPERFLGLDQAIAEIESKIARGAPLLPDLAPQ